MNSPNCHQAYSMGTIALFLILANVKSTSANHVQSYCQSIGGTLSLTNLFTEADNGTFGEGTVADETSELLPSDLTTYIYDADYPPQDGEYTVSTETTVEGFTTWHPFAGHTTGSATDRFLVINANDQIVDTEMIQSSLISGLTPHTNYTFTAYILNTVEDNPTGHIDPNVSFGIDLTGIDDDDDGTIDEPQEIEVRFSSGDIPESTEPTWVQFSFLFNTGETTSARFIIRNNNLGGFGNDLAIDDITVRECDLPSGNLEGTLYYDSNRNDNFDSGESGVSNNLTVRLVNTQGTTNTDDDVIVSRLANSDGAYSFLNIPVSSDYQVLVPNNDTSGDPIGTINPLTGISITSGSTTSNQDFGYDSNASLILVKRITAINPGQPDEITFNSFVNDLNDANDDVTNWPTDKNTYLGGEISVENIEPGDEVEYTIYFLSNGDENVKNVSICDVVPDEMTFVEDTYNTGVGIGLALDSNSLQTSPNLELSNALNDDQGEFYSSGTTPPPFCKKIDPSNPDSLISVNSSNNVSGAVSINFDNPLPQAINPGNPSNSYGFIRFRFAVK